MNKGAAGQRDWSHLLRRPVGPTEGRSFLGQNHRLLASSKASGFAFGWCGFSSLPPAAERGRGVVIGTTGCCKGLCAGKWPPKSATLWRLLGQDAERGHLGGWCCPGLGETPEVGVINYLV